MNPKSFHELLNNLSREEVEKIISDEVMRTLSAGLATNSKFLGAAKGRFVRNNIETKRCHHRAPSSH